MPQRKAMSPWASKMAFQNLKAYCDGWLKKDDRLENLRKNVYQIIAIYVWRWCLDFTSADYCVENRYSNLAGVCVCSQFFIMMWYLLLFLGLFLQRRVSEWRNAAAGRGRNFFEIVTAAFKMAYSYSILLRHYRGFQKLLSIEIIHAPWVNTIYISPYVLTHACTHKKTTSTLLV